MLVVLDANILIADFQMTGNAFRALLVGGDEAGVHVGVPEVVVQEATRKLRRELEEQARRATKLVDELRKLLVKVDVRIEIDAVVRDYEAKLRALVATSPGWELLPMPEVDHDQVLSRLHSATAPARAGVGGYQDVLIWETLKAQLHRDSHIVLVSNDGDFAGPDGQIGRAHV